ncbi:MAG: hypothetical protein AB7E81_19110 [Hyphomicrobiaceae bacterium]
MRVELVLAVVGRDAVLLGVGFGEAAEKPANLGSDGLARARSGLAQQRLLAEALHQPVSPGRKLQPPVIAHLSRRNRTGGAIAPHQLDGRGLRNVDRPGRSWPA